VSRIVDCPACQSGHHERHVGPWNIRPGLLGGDRCVCPGDCTDRQIWPALPVQPAPEPEPAGDTP